MSIIPVSAVIISLGVVGGVFSILKTPPTTPSEIITAETGMVVFI